MCVKHGVSLVINSVYKLKFLFLFLPFREWDKYMI